MSKLKDNLELLKILDDINIYEDEYYYSIQLKYPEEEKHPILVKINKKDDSVSYYLGNTLDCYEIDMEINMEDFITLQNYVKKLIK